VASEFLDVVLLGKEYRIACPPEKRDELQAAVSFLDRQFAELSAKTKASGECLAVMTALNIAHEFLAFQRGNGFDLPGTRRRINLMKARLDGVLSYKPRQF
jgi:cell division protein ZapA